MFSAYADPDVREETVRRTDVGAKVRLVGPGALFEVGAAAKDLGITHALVIADRHLQRTGGMQVLCDALARHGIAATVTDRVTWPPVEDDVTDGVERCRGAGCDGVVSFGGGSAHDVGKGVALLTAQGGTLHDYATDARGPDARDVERKLAHVVVGTTPGTGAETSSFAFITEAHGHGLAVLHHARLVPEAVIIDPLTHVTMPALVAGATGMGALSHAVEAYLSRAHTEQSDAAALEAIRLVTRHLPRVLDAPEDLDARLGMVGAAEQARAAFEEAGLGVVDSIGLVLSTLYGIPHGVASAIVLPHVMAYNAGSVGSRMGAVAEALGREPGGRPEEAAQSAADAVASLAHDVGIRQDLRELGLDWDTVYLCADRILRHPFIERNPRPLDQDGLVQILLDSLERHDVRFEAPPPTAD